MNSPQQKSPKGQALIEFLILAPLSLALVGGLFRVGYEMASDLMCRKRVFEAGHDALMRIPPRLGMRYAVRVLRSSTDLVADSQCHGKKIRVQFFELEETADPRSSLSFFSP